MSDARRIGKYTIESTLGKGSWATVYQGSDGTRPVALKLLPRAALDGDALERVRQATNVLGRLRHPALAGFLELLITDKAVCFVYELVQGEPLAKKLAGGKRPDLRESWDVLRQVLEALDAAHAKGAYHGDITPSNVLVDGAGRVKLTDLGMRIVAPETAGNAAYMAPEQFSEPGEARADLYQVGALAYHLVTGKPPFEGTREEVIHRAQQERPTDPSAINAKLAWQLDWVIQRALSKDPMDRFGSARELLDGLRLGLQDSIGSPLPATSPPPPAAPAAHKPQPPATAPKAAPAPAPARAAPTPTPAAKPAPEPRPAAPKTELSLEPQGEVPFEPPLDMKAPAKPAPELKTPAPSLAEKAKLIAQPPVVSTPPSREGARMRVMFVDDEERILNALKALFRNDYDVSVAGSGDEALALLRKEPAPIVVSDQRMPGMTGVELLREVKKQWPHSVRLLLTGYSDLASMVGSINEGEVFRFVKKPWDNDEIKTALADAAALSSRLAARTPTPPEAQKATPTVLVVDPAQGLAKVLETLMGREAAVRQVANVPEAAKLLQTLDCAAIVADLLAGKEDLVKLFRVVKAKRPETLSILIADEADADLVADLINQAQIYRFLAKPVNSKDLKDRVGEALRHHAEFKPMRPPPSGLSQKISGPRPDKPVAGPR